MLSRLLGRWGLCEGFARISTGAARVRSLCKKNRSRKEKEAEAEAEEEEEEAEKHLALTWHGH
jgi:hypothetical protein